MISLFRTRGWRPNIFAVITALISAVGSARAEPAPSRPIIAFLPGFMGSAIEKCAPDCVTGCTTIWGKGADKYDLEIDAAACHKHYLYEDDEALFGIVNKAIYSTIKNRMAMSIEDYLTTVTLPYDWRRTPGKAAEQINDRLCGITQRSEVVDLYFMAHSYGGLVLKSWLRNHSRHGECPDGSRRTWRTKELAFVSTPHLGAPSTIEYLLGGYKLVKSTPERAYSYFSIRGMEDAITRDAPLMESTYTLLPALGNLRCHSGPPPPKRGQFLFAPPFGLYTTRANMSAGRLEQLDISDHGVWNKWQLLRNYRGLTNPQLQTISGQISRIQRCTPPDNPADFLDDAYGAVVYVFGSGLPTTETVALKAYDNNAPLVLNKSGDGTVPEYSAANFPEIGKSHRSYLKRVTGADAEHLKILGTNEVSDILYHWQGNLNIRLERGEAIPTGGAPEASAPPDKGVPDPGANPRDRTFEKMKFLPIDPGIDQTRIGREAQHHNIGVLKAAGLTDADSISDACKRLDSTYLASFVAFTGSQAFPHESWHRFRLLGEAMNFARRSQTGPVAETLAREIVSPKYASLISRWKSDVRQLGDIDRYFRIAAAILNKDQTDLDLPTTGSIVDPRETGSIGPTRDE